VSRIAIVTGGGTGIGRATALALHRDGCKLVITGRRPEPLAETRAAIGEADCLTLAGDIREPEVADALIDLTLEAHGRIDVLVNNAGGSPQAQAATHSTRFFDKIIELNLSAAFYCAQAANTRMQVQPEGGNIVNIASVSATRASPGTAAYGAAKAGLLNLTQSLAMEWGPKVRVNAIIAGLVATGNAEAHYGGLAGLARVGASLPARRMGEPADIAAACVYLASSLAAYVSGAALAVHGGGERPSFLDLAQAPAGTNNLEHKHE